MPLTVSGISVSLQIVFAAIVGGMYDLLGPTVGALVTISLNEGLRVGFGTHFIGAANTIYGILLILCIIWGAALHYAVERPGNAWLRRRWLNRQNSLAPASSESGNEI